MTFDDIAAAAAQGQTRVQVAQALGVSRHKFRTMLQALPPITWAADATKMEAMREEVRARHRHTVRGVQGTLAELRAYFGVTISVPGIRSRCRRHGCLERALFDPVEPPLAQARKANPRNNAINK